MNKPNKRKARDEAWLDQYMEELWEEIRGDPNACGWLKLDEILETASEDESISASAGASSFLDLMRALIAIDAWSSTSAEEVIQPYLDVIKSSNSRDMVAKRFGSVRKAREWVISEWNKDRAAYDSKADFARIHARRVANEFGVPIKERTITERWLKGL
jgi:hypothetical protein